MNKISLRKIFFCTKSGFVKWLIDPKMIIFAASIIFIYNYISIPLTELSKELDISLNVFEVFIAIGNSGMVLLILPIIFMVLISDFPQLDKNVLFMISRIGKLNWLIGQVLQLIIMVMIFLLSVFLVSVVFVINISQYNFDWSNIIKTYIERNPEMNNSFVAELIPENLYNQLSLIGAFLHTFLLVFLYLIVIGLLFIIARLLNKKILSVLLSGTVIITGTVLSAIKSKLMWLLPMANSVTWLHYTKYLRKPVMPLYVSYLYFGFIICILIIIAFRLNRRAMYINT